MGLINQTGWYHGTIIDNVFGQSTNGFPQEILVLQATEVYDQENDEYLPVDAEYTEITWYGVLIDSKKKETKNSQQLKKITGWDGVAYYDVPGCLDLLSFVGMPLSFRVEYGKGDYENVLGVEWVDTIDALSGGSRLQPVTKEEGRALQAKYASVLASTKAPTKVVSAKASGKFSVKGSAKASVKTGKKPPAKPHIPKPPKTTVGKCTADDAYNACHSLKRDDVTEQALNELWLSHVAQVNEDESKVTEEQWFQIKEDLLKQVSKV